MTKGTLSSKKYFVFMTRLLRQISQQSANTFRKQRTNLREQIKLKPAGKKAKENTGNLQEQETKKKKQKLKRRRAKCNYFMQRGLWGDQNGGNSGVGLEKWVGKFTLTFYSRHAIFAQKENNREGIYFVHLITF